jgi:hypothetical protein
MNAPLLAVIAISFMLFGNYIGDQATIKDCAAKDYAVMMGGGAINCSVVKETK